MSRNCWIFLLLTVSAVLLVVLTGLLVFDAPEYAVIIGGVVLAIIVSGSLQGFFFWRRSKIYEDRSENGPDH